MSQEFNLKALNIVLKRHSVSDLKRMYKEITNKNAPNDISHFQLVKDLSAKTSFTELENIWNDKLYAGNTTVKTYRFLDSKNKKYADGFKLIKKKFPTDTWAKLINQGFNPTTLKDDTRLMHVSIIDDKSFFLFVSPGKKREVIQELTVKYLLQPQFTIAVWYNKESILQVRGQEKSAQVVENFLKYFNETTGEYPTTKQAEIPDRNMLDKLKKEVNGRATKGRYLNSTAEVTEVTLKANTDKELFDTKRSKGLIKDKYKLNAAGIDFEYKKKGYTVWVGFHLGTFWLRSGEVTEDLLDYIQTKVIKVTGI